MPASSYTSCKYNVSAKFRMIISSLKAAKGVNDYTPLVSRRYHSAKHVGYDTSR